MTSSDDRRPNYARRFFWLAFAIVTVCALYVAGWHYAAGIVTERVNTAVATANQGGRRASCENAEVRGFPFRIGVFCRSVMFVDAREGIGFRARAFRSAAQVYAPLRIIGELDGPATVEAPGLNALDLDWESMRASVRLSTPLPERVSVEGKSVTVRLNEAGQILPPLATADTAQFHMRPEDDDLALAVRFGGLALSEALANGAQLPQLDGLLDVSLKDGVRDPNVMMGRLKSTSGTLRSFTLSDETGAGATLRGPFSVDESGLVDADLQVTIRNPKALAELLAKILPESADEIRLGFSGLSAMGDEPTLPLRITKGEIRLGFLSLGSIPPL